MMDSTLNPISLDTPLFVRRAPFLNPLLVGLSNSTQFERWWAFALSEFSEKEDKAVYLVEMKYGGSVQSLDRGALRSQIEEDEGKFS